MQRAIIFLFIAFLTSCSGYSLRYSKNPFSQYGIKAVTVPMFVNRSVFSNISGMFTKEVNLLLSSYSDLRVHGGDAAHADGVLLGIISSSNRQRDAMQTTATEFTTNQELDGSIGGRPAFYYPLANKIVLELNLILIKRPTKKEIELLRSSIGDKIKHHPKVVFNEKFHLTGSVTNEIQSSENLDDGGVVNYTRNSHLQHVAIENISKDAARIFKQEVLDAF